MTVTATKLTGALGAVLDGVSIESVDDAGIDEIRRAVVAHRVVFLPAQTTDAAELVRFGARLAPLSTEHPAYLGVHPDHPEIAVVANEEGGITAADAWHTDVTWAEEPPLGTVLQLVEVPDYGGDTMWMDLVSACASLSDSFRAYLSTLEAVHRAGDREAVHPVVRTIPETGEQSLFVNPVFTSRIVGLKRKESEALLEFLYRHIDQPEYLVRWRWSSGDLGVWDNRCTWHYALGDHGGQPRRAHRLVLAGARFVAADAGE